MNLLRWLKQRVCIWTYGLRLPFPGSKGRVRFSPRLWATALLSVLSNRGKLQIFVLRSGNNPDAMAEPLAGVYRNSLAQRNNLGEEPFRHQDFRDLRAYLRLAYSGFPVLAQRIYEAHRKEHAVQRAVFLREHPELSLDVHARLDERVWKHGWTVLAHRTSLTIRDGQKIVLSKRGKRWRFHPSLLIDNPFETVEEALDAYEQGIDGMKSREK